MAAEIGYVMFEVPVGIPWILGGVIQIKINNGSSELMAVICEN